MAADKAGPGCTFEAIRALREGGMSWPKIAKHFGVSTGAVYARFMRYEDAGQAAPRQSRKCMSCQGVFDSSGAHERVCAECKKSAAWRSGAGHGVHRVRLG